MTKAAHGKITKEFRRRCYTAVIIDKLEKNIQQLAVGRGATFQELSALEEQIHALRKQEQVLKEKLAHHNHQQLLGMKNVMNVRRAAIAKIAKGCESVWQCARALWRLQELICPKVINNKMFRNN